MEESLKEDQSIVWRIRGTLHWKRGWVRKTLAGGKLVEICMGMAHPDEIMSVADIEWMEE